MHAHYHNRNGFSTIELLIAFSVGILFLTAAMMVSFPYSSEPGAVRQEQYALSSGQAAALDTQLDNDALSIASNKLGQFLADLLGDWTTPPPSALAGTYNSTTTVSDTAPCFKEVENITSWSNTIGRRGLRQMTFGTAISNMDEAIKLGPGGCDPTPPGDWDTPADTEWSVSPNSFVSKGTGIDTISLNGNSYAVITGNLGGNNKSDVFIANISSPSNPIEVSQKDIVPYGYNDVIVVGTYAYVTNNEPADQLQILDISDPTSVLRVGQISLPQAATGVPRSIFYYNGRIYIGTQYLACPPSCSPTQNHEFHIFDVTNPSNPTPIRSFNVNHHVNDIAVTQKNVAGTLKTYAFLATSDSSSSNTSPELTILDVSTPQNGISLAGSVNLPGNNNYGTSVYVTGNRLYLGREKASNSNFDFYVFDISTSASSPTIFKKRNLNIAANTQVQDIEVHGKYAFVLTSDNPANSLQIWDIASGPGETITKPSGCSNLIRFPKSVGLSYYKGLVYVINENNATVNIAHDSPNLCTAPAP